MENTREIDTFIKVFLKTYRLLRIYERVLESMSRDPTRFAKLFWQDNINIAGQIIELERKVHRLAEKLASDYDLCMSSNRLAACSKYLLKFQTMIDGSDTVKRFTEEARRTLKIDFHGSIPMVIETLKQQIQDMARDLKRRGERMPADTMRRPQYLTSKSSPGEIPFYEPRPYEDDFMDYESSDSDTPGRVYSGEYRPRSRRTLTSDYVNSPAMM